MSVKVKSLDLTKAFPASPKEVAGGYVHLARMRDKARAKAAGTLGEYHYPCPLDQALLEFLNLKAEDFIEVAQKENNEELLLWVKEKAARKNPDEVKKWTALFLEKKPDTPEKLAYFIDSRNKANPDRTDVETWVDLLDLEEGRLG